MKSDVGQVHQGISVEYAQNADVSLNLLEHSRRVALAQVVPGSEDDAEIAHQSLGRGRHVILEHRGPEGRLFRSRVQHSRTCQGCGFAGQEIRGG